MYRDSSNLVIYPLVLLTVCLSSCSPRGDELVKSSAGNIEPQQAVLASEKQEHIWEIEHAAFELEQKFGKAFCSAIQAGDVIRLEAFCRDGFSAILPSSTNPTVDDLGYIQQSHFESNDSQLQSVGRDEFAAQLISYFDRFARFEKLTCRVLDLHCMRDDPNTGEWNSKLYLAGSGKGPNGALVELVSEHQVQCHFKDDAAIEGGTILTGWKVLKKDIRTAPQPLFEEVSKSTKLAEVNIHDNWLGDKEQVRQYHSQMAVEDFDQDGFYDIAVASSNGRWRLLKSNEGKEFVEVTGDVGIPQWADEEPRSRAIRDQAYLASWIDVNNDSFPDLILGDRLFLNHQGDRFTDVTSTSGLVFGYNPRGCAIADYDCDGRLDLYVLYQHPRASSADGTQGWVGDDGTGVENHLWKNLGNGVFENTSEWSNSGGGRRQTFAASWFHANDDHLPDLYLANDFGSNVLLVNEGNGRFEDVSNQKSVSDYATSMGVATGDLTGDGKSDIYVANMFSKMGRRIISHVCADDYPPGVFEQIQGSCAGNRLYRLDDDGQDYDEIATLAGVNAVGWAYAPTLADFDLDGRLDIYSTAGFLSYRRGKPDG